MCTEKACVNNSVHCDPPNKHSVTQASTQPTNLATLSLVLYCVMKLENRLISGLLGAKLTDMVSIVWIPQSEISSYYSWTNTN